MHVAVGRPVKLLLTSEDVIHSFFVPEFRVHMDVLPGRYTIGLVQADPAGRLSPVLLAILRHQPRRHDRQVVVMEPAEYQRWLHLQAEGSLALQGRKMFLKYRCISCHSADENARAPVLEELYGKPVHLRDGRTVIADEDYIRESILNPGAKIVAGYENIMPTFHGQVIEEEIVRADRLHQVAETRARRRSGSRSYPPPATTPPINPKQPMKP